MINAIIVDDEKDGAEVLQFLVMQNCPNICIIDVVHTVENAITSIQKLKPSLVFLDIEMPTGTGFDIVNATTEQIYEKIFITAYEQYAIKAIKTNALDYLLKPVDVEELVVAVSNAEKRINSYLKNPKKEDLFNSKKIFVPSTEGFIVVDTEDIMRLEADSNYTHIYTRSKQKYMVAKTLKSFEEQLPKINFCRVHSSHIVNMKEIAKYIKGDGGIIVLKDSSSIPVSRANKKELLARLMSS